MLKPPKVLFLGDAKACAKWLPWAKRMMDRMTRFHGSYFHKKFTMNGGEATIWLDSDAFMRVIKIEGGAFYGYEFITSHKQNAAFIFDPISGYSGLRAHRFNHAVTTLKEVGGTLLGRNYRGRKVKEDEVLNADLPRVVTAGQEWQVDPLAGDGWWSQPGIDWFHVPEAESSEEAADRAVNGYRSTLMTYSLANGQRYTDDFYLGNLLHTRTLFAGDGFRKRRGSKPRKIDAVASTSTASLGGGTKGLAAAVQDDFLILASKAGFDFIFAVQHIPSGTQIEVTGPKPVWVNGEVWATWQFSPDGTRAVSVQYNSDQHIKAPLEQASFYKMGVVELKFAPSYNSETGVLTCSVSSGFEYYADDLQVVAVDYDLYDGKLLRLLKLSHYISPGIDPDGGGTLIHYGVQTVATWHTVDLKEADPAVSTDYRRRLVMYALMIEDDTQADTLSLIDPILDTSNGWESHANCRAIEAHLSGLDLRIDAWALSYIVTADNAHMDAGGRYFYYKEVGLHGNQEPDPETILPGSVHNNGWVDGRQYSEIALMTGNRYTGYGDFKTGHTLWQPDFLWRYWSDPENGMTPYARQHVFFNFNNNNQTTGFRISPEKHVALYAPPALFNTAPGAYWSRNVAGSNSGPLNMVFDLIRYRLEDGTDVTSSHEAVYNSERTVNTFSFDDLGDDGKVNSADSLAPHGVWAF